MSPFGSDLILARLQSLHPKKIDLSLARILGLLCKLGNPERRLPPVVHIAGTNGKGSTLAMLDAMLTASGKTVHRYISPHLVHFNERILLTGRPIQEQRLAEVLDRCENANGGEPITFFEITTAAAFLAFAEEAADILLLETGLGGRLDATNVIERPLLTLISPISMDHESFLGNTIEAIAFEKAGILKPEVPAILGPQRQEAGAVLEARADEVGAPLMAHGRDWTVRPDDNELVLMESGSERRWPLPSLAGWHQVENAGLAIMAAQHLAGFPVPDEAVASGLRSAYWPARLQRLTAGPLLSFIPPGAELWLDGGHNPAAGEVLARSLPEIAAGRPIHLVIGMLSSKDLVHFSRPLVPLATSIHTVPVPDEQASRDPADSAQELKAFGVEAKPAGSVAASLAALRHEIETRPGLVLICGSLYLAGYVLRGNG